MKDMLYISRSFVEFGPFSADEIQAFYKRGMLKDTDYVRHTSGDDWVHVNDWAASAPASGSTPSPAPADKAAAQPAKKAAPAKATPAEPASTPVATSKPAAKKAKK